MSQIKLLLDVVSDMRHLADSLAEYANAVTTNEPVSYTHLRAHET